MKRLATISIILTSAFCAYAQNVDKTVTLDEVTVKAANPTSTLIGRYYFAYHVVAF